MTLLGDTFDSLDQLLEEGRAKEWQGGSEFTDTLLQDDPHAIVEELNEALKEGARPVQLARAVTMAAAMRITRFHVNNEFSDWIAVLHTFSYANALHQMLKRAESPEMLRGVYHGAMRVYLDRFLNVPPARLPDEGAAAADPGEALEEYLQLLDQQQQGRRSRAARLRLPGVRGRSPDPCSARSPSPWCGRTPSSTASRCSRPPSASTASAPTPASSGS